MLQEISKGREIMEEPDRSPAKARLCISAKAVDNRSLPRRFIEMAHTTQKEKIIGYLQDEYLTVGPAPMIQ